VNLPSHIQQHFSQIPEFDLEAFESLEAGNFPTSIRLNPGKLNVSPYQGFNIQHEASAFVLNERPNFGNDPLWHAGAYYVQESASMLAGAIAQQVLSHHTQPLVLDLCAAPGGKSTHLASVIHPHGFLVANEVIQSRHSILKENLKKWGSDAVATTQRDPEWFGEQTPHAFDFILVDAPCSGEGLFRRDPKAMEEWSEANVNLCSARQKRIVMDVWGALKPGGFLVYSTCTFNRSENEDNVAFFAEETGAVVVTSQFEFLAPERINAEKTGFRFTPYSGPNEGFFLAVLQKPEESLKSKKMGPAKWNEVKSEKFPSFLSQFSLNERKIIETPVGWVSVPAEFLPLIHHLKPSSWGGILGTMKGKDFIPEETSALLLGFQPENALELDLEWALKFLQGETQLPLSGTQGWKTITYQNVPLGWVKEIGNRMNNYWPKGWRKR